MMNVDEMRAIARDIKQRLPGVADVRFTIGAELLELEVKMKDGRVFFDGVNLAHIERTGLGDLVVHAFTDGIHKFVRDHLRRAAA